jgi:hypothetical protein
MASWPLFDLASLLFISAPPLLISFQQHLLSATPLVLLQHTNINFSNTAITSRPLFNSTPQWPLTSIQFSIPVISAPPLLISATPPFTSAPPLQYLISEPRYNFSSTVITSSSPFIMYSPTFHQGQHHIFVSSPPSISIPQIINNPLVKFSITIIYLFIFLLAIPPSPPPLPRVDCVLLLVTALSFVPFFCICMLSLFSKLLF